MRIPLSQPDIGEREIEYVTNVLRSGQLSLGPKVAEFEEKFADYVGTRYAVATNSGTSALHLCVKALGIGRGDEVLTTSFSFVASANCLLYEKALPVFVDISPSTLNIDPAAIREVSGGGLYLGPDEMPAYEPAHGTRLEGDFAGARVRAAVRNGRDTGDRAGI